MTVTTTSILLLDGVEWCCCGAAHDARCIATWGDGGIYKRTLIYDTNNHPTLVTDSHDVHHPLPDERRQRRRVRDRRAWRRDPYQYDDCYNKIAEVDPLDHTTKWSFDERGNCTNIVYLDGAPVTLFYDERNSVVRAIDAIKGPRVACLKQSSTQYLRMNWVLGGLARHSQITVFVMLT